MSDVRPPSNEQSPFGPTPAHRLVYSTVRLECEYDDGGTGGGTGFIFSFARRGDEDAPDFQHAPAVVTNRHVVEGARRGAFHLHRRSAGGGPSSRDSVRLVFEDFRSGWIPHPDPTVDLCVMPLASAIGQVERAGLRLSSVALGMGIVPTDQELAGLTPLEEVVMVGYPNGIWDSRNNMPILRRGVTATHPAVEYEGRREFMIDAACFPGSSGSPVFLCNVGGHFTPGGAIALGSRLKLLGVLWGGPQYTATGELQVVAVPTRQREIARFPIPMNLGLVIQSSRLRDFEEHFLRLWPGPAGPGAATAADAAQT
jgi:hypothetical protein